MGIVLERGWKSFLEVLMEKVLELATEISLISVDGRKSGSMDGEMLEQGLRISWNLGWKRLWEMGGEYLGTMDGEHYGPCLEYILESWMENMLETWVENIVEPFMENMLEPWIENILGPCMVRILEHGWRLSWSRGRGAFCNMSG